MVEDLEVILSEGESYAVQFKKRTDKVGHWVVKLPK